MNSFLNPTSNPLLNQLTSAIIAPGTSNGSRGWLSPIGGMMLNPMNIPWNMNLDQNNNMTKLLNTLGVINTLKVPPVTEAMKPQMKTVKKDSSGVMTMF